MTCEDLLDKIIDFHLGDLEEAESLRIAAHLESCASCAAALQRLELETGIYREYAEQVDRQLGGSVPEWSRFRKRLDASGRRESPKVAAGGMPGFFRHWPARLAASLLLVLAVGVGYVLFNLGEPLRKGTGTGMVGTGDPAIGNDAKPARASDGSGGGGLQQALLAIQKAEKEYLDAIRLLSTIVEKEKPRLDPRKWEEFEKSLKVVDESIMASRAEYMARPSDPELALHMLSAYNRKVELLQEMAS